MEQLRPLPVREMLLPGESLTSLVRRHAVAMGYENLQWILRELSVAHSSQPMNTLASDSLLESLAELLRQPRDQLGDSTVHRFARELILVPRETPCPEVCDSKTVSRFFTTAHPPVCPACLQKELAYERLLWSFRPLPVCREHGCLLIASCSSCGRAFRPDRLELRRCRCGIDLASSPVTTVPIPVRSLTEVFHRGVTQREPPIVGLTVAAGFSWAERLASAIGRTPAWQDLQREHWSLPAAVSAENLAWLAAADLFQDWPNRFFAFLEVFQTVTRHRHSATGVGRAFGLLLREAQYLEQLGITIPADALREYLLARYTRGHLNAKVCLFQNPKHHRKVTHRPWMSQTDAARQLALRHGAVAGLVRRGVLTGEVTATGSRGRSVGLVSRVSVEALCDDLQTALTVPDTARRLGLGRSRVFELIHGELLPRAVRTIDGWRIPLASVEALLGQLERLPVGNASLLDSIQLREATRRFGRRGLTLVRLLTAVLHGHVPAFRMFGSSDFHGIRLHVEDLRTLLSRVQREQQVQHGYSLTQLAAALFPGHPLKDVVLRKWIGAGLLVAHKTGRTWRIAPDEVDRFRSIYCLAAEACRFLGIHRKTLSRWEAEGRIAAVYGRHTAAGAGASVFRRADLALLRDG